MVEENYEPGFFRVCANIDLDAICNNVLEIRKKYNSSTKIMAVIKADGYGHGAVPIARALDSYADIYGMAVIEEAIELRRAGIIKDIMLLGAVFKEQINSVVAYDVIATVFSLDIAKALSKEAVKQDKTARLHIKVDTGMGRLGYQPYDESINEIKEIYQLPNICVEGIFTHFACADHADKTSAEEQYNIFMRFVYKLEIAGIIIPIKHASNSAAIIDMPDTGLNMVRSGITTYGLYPSDEVVKDNLKLLPAMEIKAHISHIKFVPPGSKIGYGSTYVTKRKSIIATIPVGYADGYPRNLSNKGYVLIKGKKAPIIGRICMDQFMVDVTDIEHVTADDIVTLIGRDGDAYISVEEPAEMIGSFNYEFVCNISKRVPRIYYKNNIPFLIRKTGSSMSC